MKKGIETTSLTTVIATRYFATFEAAVEYAQNTEGVCYKEGNIGAFCKDYFLATAWVEEVGGLFELNVECADFELANRIDATIEECFPAAAEAPKAEKATKSEIIAAAKNECFDLRTQDWEDLKIAAVKAMKVAANNALINEGCAKSDIEQYSTNQCVLEERETKSYYTATNTYMMDDIYVYAKCTLNRKKGTITLTYQIVK